MTENETTNQQLTETAEAGMGAAQPMDPAGPAKPDPVELVKLKAALDKAAKEAADYKKQLRAKQTAEEARAEEERTRQEAIEQELNELRKQSAVSGISKRVMAFTSDEAASNSIAEFLYGASDTDAALDALQKAWVMREKKLRMEYGKLPAPEAGNDRPSMTREQVGAMSYAKRAEFFAQYPDLYEKLMR